MTAPDVVTLGEAMALCHDLSPGDFLVRGLERIGDDACGFADDLDECAAIDSYPVIPLYQDRQITKLGPERER